jgi:hypothetical protein
MRPFPVCECDIARSKIKQTPIPDMASAAAGCFALLCVLQHCHKGHHAKEWAAKAGAEISSRHKSSSKEVSAQIASSLLFPVFRFPRTDGPPDRLTM